MSDTTSTRTSPLQHSLAIWWDRIHGKIGKWILIASVVGYVAFLIVTPIAALAVGAFERGIAASLECVAEALRQALCLVQRAVGKHQLRRLLRKQWSVTETSVLASGGR